uniref:Uncharacterized protein n=1 Tax=Chenopodium quinoa TaxID=63459 RepID=A0A803L1N5_CHEQI
MLWRMLHQQLWISLSRYRTAKGNNLIVDRSIDFEQVDRESKWDDQILLNGILFYIAYWVLEDVKNMPLWRMDGLLVVFILHIGPVDRVPLLLVTSRSTPSLPLLSLPLSSPFFYCISTPYWYHSLHHTHIVYETSLKKPEDVPDVAHLTHLTTLQSVYHLRLGFASLASKRLNYKWYMWLIWPLTCWSALITWAYGRTFIIERNTFKKLKAKLWIVPCFKKEVSYFHLAT